MDRLTRLISLSIVFAACALASGSNAANVQEIDGFVGVSGGYTHVDPRSGQGTSKNGYHLMLTAFADVVSENWVFGAGGGLFYNRIYSDGEKDYPGSQTNTVREQTKLRIETRAGAAELASRYRLGANLEAGLVLRGLFGSSLSFSQEKGDKATKFFAGPQVVLRTGPNSDWIQRVDVNVTTDFNVPQKRVYLFTAGLALGKSYKQPKEAASKAPPAPNPEDRYEEILADKVINFATGSSEVQGSAKGFLEDLGKFLKANPDLWKAVEVEGHTDKKGKLAYNMKLSKDRAEAVRKVLIGQGADAGKVSAQGFGPTRPLIDQDTPEALAANRRVVMIFNVNGRDQRNKLSVRIKELRKQYFNE